MPRFARLFVTGTDVDGTSLWVSESDATCGGGDMCIDTVMHRRDWITVGGALCFHTSIVCVGLLFLVVG